MSALKKTGKIKASSEQEEIINRVLGEKSIFQKNDNFAWLALA